MQLALTPLAGLLLAVLAPGSLTQDPSGEEPRTVPAGPEARVDQDLAALRVRELCALGPRMGGTPSNLRAANYLAGHFQAAGLLVRTLTGPERLIHWEEPWTVVAKVGAKGTQPATELPLERSWPYGYSPSTAGTWPLSLEPIDGHVALLTKAHRPPREGPELAAALVDGHDADGWPKLIALRASARNRYPVFGIGAENGATLRGWLEAGRDVDVTVELKSHIAKVGPLTLEARLAAREGAPPGVLLLCAHGDSDAGGPGANDNASGVAVVLAIAEAWSAAIRAGELEAPPREVRFLIWGSEIHSTRHYLETQLAETPCVGVFNWDQAGFGSGAEQLNIEPDDLPANVELVRALDALLGQRAGRDGFPARWATNKSLGGTDSYVFSSSQLFRDQGIPAITMFTSAWDKPEEHPRTEGMPGESWSERDLVNVDYDANYHSAGDLPERTTDLEPHNLGWCARVGLVGALEWLARVDQR